ncbi:methenyltetrahydromethanopterin cyclohydrolase [Candidatus Bathyarchaeota archaeon]|nr:methenyltetrahydromethanopterin cyclohydrolase [Candidatus Bathyarchaeota archaeon]
MEKEVSVNNIAWNLLISLCENAQKYNVKVKRAECGATIVDAGIQAKGGLEAGRLITEICMGGLGRAELTRREYGGIELPCIYVYTDYPAISSLGAQLAGWNVKEGDYSAIGSGPARALALKPKGIYEHIGYKDSSDKAVLVLETDKEPPENVLRKVAEDCCVECEKLAVILTPTSSIAGAVQIAGRIVETGMQKLMNVGLDPQTVMSAWGISPIPPAHPKFLNAMARTNDVILYGGVSYFTVEYEDDDDLAKIVEKAPSSASKDYGKPFLEIFKEAGKDFYKVDPAIFAPAVVIVNNVKTGNVFKAGEINPEPLLQSLGFK